MAERKNAVLNPIYVHGQALFDEVGGASASAILEEPLIVEALIPINDFLAITTQWRVGDRWTVDAYTFTAPLNMTSLQWNEDSSLTGPTQRLLAPIEVEGSPLLLKGWSLNALGGGNSPTEVINELARRAPDLGYDDFRDLTSRVLGRTYTMWPSFAFDFVVPAGAGLRGDIRDGVVSARLYVQAPLTTSQYWVRGSHLPFSSQLPMAKWEPETTIGDGWQRANGTFRVPEDAHRFHVWSGRADVPEMGIDFDLDPITPERQRHELLGYIYEQSHRPFGSDILAADKLQGGADFFELALANALAACGFAVLATGSPLKTKGIDLVAFHTNTVAVIVSATAANDVARKLNGLLGQRAAIEAQLSRWQCRWVIVAAVPAQSVAASAVSDCNEAGVHLLTKEQLDDLAQGRFADFRANLVARLQLA
ncbi:MAG: hypothetical protein ACYDA0_13455 [Candidatus Dormibacteraceae bacterium]